MLYRFLRANGIKVPGPTRGLDSPAIQVPVRVAEASHRCAHYLAKNLSAIADFVVQLLRIQAGESWMSNGVRTDLYPPLRDLADTIGLEKPQPRSGSTAVFPGIHFAQHASDHEHRGRETQPLQRRQRRTQEVFVPVRSEEHTSELQSRQYLVCRLLLEKKKNIILESHDVIPSHHLHP